MMKYDRKAGKRKKNIKLWLKNESCADFYADHQKPVQTGRKNKIKIYDFFTGRTGTGPDRAGNPIAPA